MYTTIHIYIHIYIYIYTYVYIYICMYTHIYIYIYIRSAPGWRKPRPAAMFVAAVEWWGLPTRPEWALAPDRGAGVTKLGPWLHAWPPGVCVGLGCRN